VAGGGAQATTILLRIRSGEPRRKDPDPTDSAGYRFLYHAKCNGCHDMKHFYTIEMDERSAGLFRDHSVFRDHSALQK
jgi:hypothetical protein